MTKNKKINCMTIEEAEAKLAKTSKNCPYDDGHGNIDYALVGQDYLHQLGIEIEEL